MTKVPYSELMPNYKALVDIINSLGIKGVMVYIDGRVDIEHDNMKKQIVETTLPTE